MRARIAPVGFLRRMQGRIPDFGARTIVFIPSHLFHPLHHCEKLAACGGAMGNAKREGRRSMIAALSFGVHVTGCGAIVSACT